MSKRRNFLRDCFMACAVSLLPKILQPQLPVVESEKEVDVEVRFVTYNVSPHGTILAEADIYTHTWRLPERVVDFMKTQNQVL